MMPFACSITGDHHYYHLIVSVTPCTFNVDHDFSCPYGGFPSIRHNELRTMTAQLLTEVCYNIGLEPGLQPLNEEQFNYRTANMKDSARLDIKADSFPNPDRLPSLIFLPQHIVNLH